MYIMSISNLQKFVFLFKNYSVTNVSSNSRTNPRNEIGEWEKHTKGIGAKLLLKVSKSFT